MTTPNPQRSIKDLDNHWHLDKRVPIAIVFAFILQTVYFTVFLTKLDSRVSENNKHIQLLERDREEGRKTLEDIAEIKIHQRYLREKFEKLNDFLRDDVEWIKPKKYKGQ